MSTAARPLHPVTGLVLVQPTDCLVTDADMVALARAEGMFRHHPEADRTRAVLLAAGIEHGYTRERVAC